MQNEKNEQSEKLYTRVEAAEYLGIAFTTLRTWATRKRDLLPYRRVGHKVQYTQSDLDAYIKTRIRK